MKIIEHVQGSPEWLLWRQHRITATSCSIIMSLNPFKTLGELWDDMMGISAPVSNDAMRRGQELEPIARELFIKETGIHVTPICAEHDGDWWMAASLDGISQDHKTICEIKCPTKMKTHTDAIVGMIPKYYYAQCQHQLFVTGAERVLYTSYHPDCHPDDKYDLNKELAIVEILPDSQFIETLRERSKYFYEEHICQMKRPTVFLTST